MYAKGTCRRSLLWGALCLMGVLHAGAAELTDTIAAAKPAIVAIATMQNVRSPAIVFFGTGFAVSDGLTVVTNAHVVTPLADAEKSGTLGVLIRSGQAPTFRPARVIALDREHDLALLRIEGAPLATLRLGDAATIREGRSLVFTGFPLGMALGFHHATHRAMVSAITPVIQPGMTAAGLEARSIRQLQQPAYCVFQLDATAYPGNSGSPLYDPATGLVYGIINMVFVKGLKETALTQPSGITYAIEGRYIQALLATRPD